mmetsp:Transcript_127682/g.303365  ORF Transcript_127682/g.303365 Transcript_127682/m.303365 type:complete len:111 (+) Transcript_127682:373-705(+)
MPFGNLANAFPDKGNLHASHVMNSQCSSSALAESGCQEANEVKLPLQRPGALDLQGFSLQGRQTITCAWSTRTWGQPKPRFETKERVFALAGLISIEHWRRPDLDRTWHN